MKDLIRFELAKIARRRTHLYGLAFLNMFPLLHMLMIVAVTLWGGEAIQSFAAASVRLFVPAHVFNGYVAIPVLILLLLGEGWIEESRNRSLTTLILCQVGRLRLLAAKLVAVDLVVMGGVAMFMALYILDIMLARRLFPAGIWAPHDVRLDLVLVALLKYLVLFGLAVLPVLMFFQVLCIRLESVKAVVALGWMALLVGWFLEYRIEEWLDLPLDRRPWIFTRSYGTLVGVSSDLQPSLIIGVLTGSSPDLTALGPDLVIVLANAGLLGVAAWSMLHRKEFHS